MPMTINDSQERGSHGSPSANADKHGFCLLSAGICVAKHQRHPRLFTGKDTHLIKRQHFFKTVGLL